MKYQKVTPQDVAYLEGICPGRVWTGEGIPVDYTHDEMTEYGSFAPEAAVDVLTTQEVSAVLAYASARHIPVTPRGAGTGLCGGAVAIHGGIVLCTARMNRVLEIDEEQLMAVVQPGVLLMDFAKQLEGRGLFYPPDPGEKSATLGGNVMTNAGGMRAVKYGVTRDYVRGMQVVLPSGQVLELGGKVAKNSSGYSIKDLMIGSEGTLGIVTQTTLRLLPAPTHVISLLVPFETLEQCVHTVPQIIQSRFIPSAIEFMQREVIEAAEEFLGKPFPDKSAQSYLLLSFDGNSQQEIDTIFKSVADLCLACGAIDVLIAGTQERQQAIWSARGAFLEAIKSSTPTMDECDVVVPRGQIAAFIRFVDGLGKQHGIRIRTFGHAGDGNIHVYVCRDDLDEAAWQQRNGAVMRCMYDWAAQAGGQVSGEHGIGHAKSGYLKQAVGEDAIQLMRGIKAAFDPQGILNPGKVVG